MNLTVSYNAEYIEEQYRLWKENPRKVTPEWQSFFKGFELGLEGKGVEGEICGEEDLLRQSRVEALIYRYRDLGHLLSCLDPLVSCPTDHPLLNLSAFDLREADLEREVHLHDYPEPRRATLKEIVKTLRETYCRSIGVEYMHLQDPEERRWLQDRMEPTRNRPNLKEAEKIRILHKLHQAALFEQFLHKKYVGQTRFSVEGADAVIPVLDALVQWATSQGFREIILGMAHRGRLNVQVNILGKPYKQIFHEFEGSYDPESIIGSGDVKYHNGYLTEIEVPGDRKVLIFLVNNPSHLESVDPVVEGIARARQDNFDENGEDRVLPLLIHGDAAFAGEGIVAETLNLSQLKGYGTGGTVHLVINNQIGYTTLPEDARSTRYSTDVAKMLMVPIFHVHGEDPEAAVHVIQLALDYRARFHKDVVVDLVCYRRYGHNEGDEPYFTQPLMYDRIKDRPPLYKIYTEKLREEGIIEKGEAEKIAEGINQCLNESFEQSREKNPEFPRASFFEEWENFHGDDSPDAVETGVDEERLVSLAEKLNSVPDDFSQNKKLEGLFKKRLESVKKGEGIDWANAEALAFASLAAEGTPVRLSGQDSGRGTFSQRHSVLVDTESGDHFTPLNHLKEDQAPFRVYDSMLSEAGVLAFEYGYSLAAPKALVLWEAQFGDFVNNAQAVIDLYIVSGEAKWQRLSGLTLLLPHGLEGLGPEHSSARPERFLQLCAGENIQVCNPTTPAQYFHLLRRQVNRSVRKPLVVLTPKSLLRHPLAVSRLSDMASGSFREILDDPEAPDSPNTVFFCSGKIFYELLKRRRDLEKSDIAIVRIEQFYPFAEKQLQEAISRYKKAKTWAWVQEEPENMGGWRFMRPYLESLTGKQVDYIGRKASPSPASGISSVYKKDQAAIIEEAIGS